MFSLRDSVRRTFLKVPRHRRSARPRLKVEHLETRQLLSTFALSNAGVLTQGTTVVDQNVSSFQTDSAGDLFELKTNGGLWLLPSGGDWTPLDVNVGSFNVNSSGVLAEVKTNGTLWQETDDVWTKVAGNVSQAGITGSGEIYYLTTAGGFNDWTSATGSTQINPTQDPVMSFQLGGTGNEQVYYQYGSDTPSGSYMYAIFDWTDHSAAKPYGINASETLITDTGLNVFSGEGGQYAVGTNGDLYVVGYARSTGVTIAGMSSSAQTATVTATTAAKLFVGEAADGVTGINNGSVITSISSDVLHFKSGVTGNSGSSGNFYDQVAGQTSGTAIYNDRVVFYAPNTTAPTVGSLFQALDSTTSTPIEINNLVETPDQAYLYFTGESEPDLYFDRYAIGAATPLVQLDKIASTTGSPVTFQVLVDLRVGGDDSAYVLDLTATDTNSIYNVTNSTLLGATVTGTTSLIVDSDVLLPNTAQTAKVLPTTSTYSPYAVAPNGNVIVVQTDGKLVEFNNATGGSGLVLDGTGATLIAVSSNGEFFEGKSNGNFWELTFNDTWTELDTGGLSSFGIAPNGAVYELKTNGNFWNYVGGSGTASSSIGWTKISSGVTTFLIADGENGNGSAPLGAGSFSAPDVSYEGQVGYVSAGAAYLLLPSQYNLNAEFLIGTSGYTGIAFGSTEVPFLPNLMEFELFNNPDDLTNIYV